MVLCSGQNRSSSLERLGQASHSWVGQFIIVRIANEIGFHLSLCLDSACTGHGVGISGFVFHRGYMGEPVFAFEFPGFLVMAVIHYHGVLSNRGTARAAAIFSLVWAGLAGGCTWKLATAQ